MILRVRGASVNSVRPLFDIAATRAIEQAAQSKLPAHTLLQRAGLSTAKLALALAPHTDTFWIACGPGNNGGDGLEAAAHLKNWGKSPVVTWLGDPATAPADSALSRQRAVDAGIRFADSPPAKFDFCVDALLGIGASNHASRRPIEGRLATWVAQINSSSAPVLAVDVPTGLNADTGDASALCVRATATLSLLTLKPGLFTAQGRDACGDIWFDALEDSNSQGAGSTGEPSAWLAGVPARHTGNHASHKGSFGEVLVIGGAAGMTGAALLAATAALHFGAGRVFVMLLDGGSMTADSQQPELMFRPFDDFNFADQLTTTFAHITFVCGCGGGTAVQRPLGAILASAANAVLDADALNAIAFDKSLSALLSKRAKRGLQTVLTPHPLEAARLLETTTQQVQQNRIASATALAQQFNCTVVLKGSGTVVATPGQTPVINPTGNALLAIAGTGDVLAGMVGARLAGLKGRSMTSGTTDFAAFQAACEAVYLHGDLADRWPAQHALTASRLARGIAKGVTRLD